jgi:hypothetical protein
MGCIYIICGVHYHATINATPCGSLHLSLLITSIRSEIEQTDMLEEVYGGNMIVRAYLDLLTEAGS